MNQTQAALARSVIPHKSVSISWNPHRTLPHSHKSSLIDLYGPAGPPPPSQSSIAIVNRRRRSTEHLPRTSILAGSKLPRVAFSFLDQNQKVQTTSLESLSKNKRLVVVSVQAAFSPVCTRFVQRIVAAKLKLADLIACVAVNDVFVMKAWGEKLALGEKVKVLSDAGGDLSKALGLPLDFCGGGDRLGLGARSRRFYLSAMNSVVMDLSLDLDDDEVMSSKMKAV